MWSGKPYHRDFGVELKNIVDGLNWETQTSSNYLIKSALAWVPFAVKEVGVELWDSVNSTKVWRPVQALPKSGLKTKLKINNRLWWKTKSHCWSQKRTGSSRNIQQNLLLQQRNDRKWSHRCKLQKWWMGGWKRSCLS